MPRPCSVCALPRPALDELKRLRRNGVGLREIATTLAELGYPPVHRDAVHRHLNSHVADLDPPPADAEDRSLLLAVLVRDRLRNWHGLADGLAVEVHEHGLVAEAKLIQTAACEMMRTPLDAIPPGSPSATLLEAEALARAVRDVLRRPGPAHPAVALAVSGQLRELGAISLAEAFESLAATRPTTGSPAGPGEQYGSSLLGPAGPQPPTTSEEQP